MLKRALFVALLTVSLCSSLVAKPAMARSAPESFAPLVEKLIPAVVNISTSQKIKSRGGMKPGLPFMFQFPDDPQFDPFRQFFEQFNQGPGAGAGKPAEREVYSLGSGFIIDPQGYVVTNNHVIADAEEIHVILHDDTKLEAKIIGRDDKTDLALLKVESKKPLPAVKFGDSDEIKVGDWIIAIGNPFGLGGSVTAGIISARSRSINAGPFDDFLQTDAAINRGNSGGPMFNLDGEVIGVNTAIFSPSGGNVGIGFAVPSALSKPVIQQLKEHGRTFRGWLGVKIQHVTEQIAESVGLPRAYGALVLEINKDSPAAKADIEPGDVIISFDGKEVEEMRKLPRMVAEKGIGKTVEMVLWRDGKERRTQVKLGELDETEDQAQADASGMTRPDGDDVKTKEILGMELAAIDKTLRSRYGLQAEREGLIVLKVTPGTAASDQKLARGDVITRVNDKPIKSVKDLLSALETLRKSGRGYALVRILRDDQNLFVTLPTKFE